MFAEEMFVEQRRRDGPGRREQSQSFAGEPGQMFQHRRVVNGFIDVASHKYLSVGLNRIVSALYVFTLLALGTAIADSFLQ